VEKAHWEFNGSLIFESVYISRVSEDYRHLLDTDDKNKKHGSMYQVATAVNNSTEQLTADT